MDPNGAGPEGSDSPIDFDQANLNGPAAGAIACAQCEVPIGDGYYTLGEAVYCPRCKDGLEAALGSGGGMMGCVRAGGFGLAAAAGGALLWAGVVKMTGYELGIIAIAVGWAVGLAVKVGSGRGGVPYQLMAVALTYLAIVSTYVPLVLDTWSSTPIEEMMGDEAAWNEDGALEEDFAIEAGLPAEGASEVDADAMLAANMDGLTEEEAAMLEEGWPIDEAGELEIDATVVIAAFVLSLALPFMMGFENAIGLLIIGIALWEAWRQSRKVNVEISGPYRVGDVGA